jgi:hypothetical protein
MTRKGHFLGGGTVVGYRDPSWFKKGSMRVPPNVSAPKPPRSLTEQAALQALRETRETGTTLIPKGQKKRTKKRFGKTRAGGPKPSVIKPERSEPNRATTEVRQACRKGRSRAVTVEFVSQDGPSRKKPG